LGGGPNAAAQRCAATIKSLEPAAHILVVGGGEVGSGSEALYADPHLVTSIDIYASHHTDLVADAHNLPFRSGSFDVVWIQAVLEHVTDPGAVVAEIHRVLRPSGIVFADTPFMQPVHEGAYDFTRFSLSGHRWLFRNFEEIESGPTAGAGTALVWSIRYFIRALFRSNKAGTLASWIFFWLRYFDGRTREHMDAASGVYFLGRRSNAPILAPSLIGYYNDASLGLPIRK
jgi:SAM-dependent methyltransferase